PDIVNIKHYPKDKKVLKSSFVVIASKRTNIDVSVEKHEDEIRVNTGSLIVVVDTLDRKIYFRDPKGRYDVAEIHREFIPFETENFNSILEFDLGDEIGIYGLGQHCGFSAHSSFNYKDKVVYLAQRNTDIAIPFMISPRGFGVFWDMYSMATITSRGRNLLVWFEADDLIDYYFINGDTIDKVILNYHELTGHPPLLPKWAFGYWQSKAWYVTQDEIIEVVKRFRSEKIPLDIIVQDARYWGKYGWNAMKFDEERYRSVENMTKLIHEMNAKIIVSIWPIFGDFFRRDEPYTVPKTCDEIDVCIEAREKGCLMENSTVINVFKEECRDWLWRVVKDRFYEKGFDGWWLDANEPEVIRPLLVYTPLHHDLKIDSNTPYYKYLNVYSLFQCRAFYEGQRRTTNKRVLILSRSGFAGIQKYSVVNWSGDVTADWTTLRTQIWCGLNYSISGNPYWTTDTAGFFTAGTFSRGYNELFIRWFQFSTFTPVLRTHSLWFSKEPWSFPDEIKQIIISYIKLRYRLLPYIYSIAWKAHRDGYVLMRYLFMDFPDDRNVYSIDDQYMFGPFILVAPVTTPNTRYKYVYLPRGTWYDFWTGEKFQGPSTVKVNTPLSKIPLFIKAGSIIPMAPLHIQHALEKYQEMELRVYPGQDGEFILYEDDGETYNYEKGDYAIIPIKWLDKNQQLHIGSKIGNYSLQPLRLNIVIVKENHGTGLQETKPDIEIDYHGEEITIDTGK
ncbi:MAG: glycoside hydrolase family 31 protein, partial [Ignisphaera sp.]